MVAKRILAEMERPFEILGCFVSGESQHRRGHGGRGRRSQRIRCCAMPTSLSTTRARQGESATKFSTGSMGVETNLLQERERDLRHALSNRKFELWYEPIFRLATGELEGFESILRFRRADGSIDSFNDLLPAAEETGLSISIGREALETVCGQLRNWSNTLPGNTLTLTVNLTHRQFFHEDMAAHLKRTLAMTKADPSRLILEIPEAAVNERPDDALAIVQRIEDCGVRVALDDFGSGLAAFNNLVRLPIDLVKMDSQLSIAAVKTGSQLALLESVIRLGKTIGVQSLAQGSGDPGATGCAAAAGVRIGPGAAVFAGNGCRRRAGDCRGTPARVTSERLTRHG